MSTVYEGKRRKEMAKRFYLPTQIHFGIGARSVIPSLVNPAGKRVFIITDPGVRSAGPVDTVCSVLSNEGFEFEIFDEVKANPRADTVDKALKAMNDAECDSIVGVGGGSALDVGKVVAALASNSGSLAEYQWEGRQFENDPFIYIAVPTTAGTGSEVTRAAVIIDRDMKKGIAQDRLFPFAAVVDAELMRTVPPSVTAATGMDVLSHAIEAYVGLNRNPVTDGWAYEAMRLAGKYLLRAYANGDDMVARDGMALASTLAGAAMDQGGLGVIHAMAGPLSSIYDMPHGISNAVLLPIAMKYNLIAAPDRFADVSLALGIDVSGVTPYEAGACAVNAVRDLVRQMGIAVNWQSYGHKPEDTERFADEALKMFMIKNNPRKVSRTDCIKLFKSLFEEREDMF